MRRNAIRVVPGSPVSQDVQILLGGGVRNVGKHLCTFGVARTLPGLLEEQGKLLDERRERRAHFIVRAFDFAQAPTEDNRLEMDGAALALQATDEALAGVAADIRLIERRR